MTYEDVIKHFGSQAGAARALGIKPPSVSEWQETSIPYGRQCEIQIATGGRLKARKTDDVREKRKNGHRKRLGS